MKFLCTADLHIGRRPSRLPAAWSGGRVSAASAWLALVDWAVAEGVDAVLLAGDLVDQDNRFFEAWGPLDAGLVRLREAGIAAIAVAGNHDHHTLHEVASQVGDGHLVVLGRGGGWERHTLRGTDGSARAHVDGWSFPDSRHATDPVADYDLSPPDDGAPVVGLLHCDLDSTEPRYAPVPAASLVRVPVAGWVLGHRHVPELREDAGRPPVLYPGSLQALDPGEPGWRGAWLLELERDRSPSFRPVPLARVRYDDVAIDVAGAADPDALRGRVAGALREHLAGVVDEAVGPLELVSCRVRLTGRTPLHARVAELLAELESLEPEQAGVRLVVERVVAGTRPALDLDDLARGSDAPAALARLVLELESAGPAGDGEQAELVARAVAAAAGVAGRSHYSTLESVASDGRARAALGRQATRLLDELVRQKERA